MAISLYIYQGIYIYIYIYIYIKLTYRANIFVMQRKKTQRIFTLPL